MKKAAIFIMDGFEEVEALTVVDILRRAGVEVTMSGIKDKAVEGRNGIKVLPDAPIDKIKDKEFDMLVLPGGAKGTENLKKDEMVREIILGHFKKGRFIAAICAAPTILAKIGVTKGRSITSHPSVREELKGENVVDERVVADGPIITSQSPGTAMEFAFKLVEALMGGEKAKEVNKGVIAKL